MAALALTLSQASAEARSTKFASTTRSIGILVSRNGKERVYHFDARGRVVGREIGGEVFMFDEPLAVRR